MGVRLRLVRRAIRKTDDLVYMLDGLGVQTSVDRERLGAASALIVPRLNHPLPSRYLSAAASAPNQPIAPTAAHTRRTARCVAPRGGQHPVETEARRETTSAMF